MGIHLLLWPAHRAHILAWLSPRFFQDYICISHVFFSPSPLLTPPFVGSPGLCPHTGVVRRLAVLLWLESLRSF